MSKRVSESELKAVFGRRLNEARKRRQLTQEALADAISMSVDMVGRLERGTTQPSFETIARLCSTLQVDAQFLFGGEEESTTMALPMDTRTLIDRIRTLSPEDVKRINTAVDLIVR
ncbi:MAG: helix-turn-helix transcriptional regulator [Oceanicaulis sp.]|nr:helix-turn-helix transcriptional regulator [Oceanicaulis sp.]